MASVVGYARLSTVEQTRGTLTLEQQVSRLKEAGAGEVLVDLMSGTSEARPRYRELIRRVKAGTVEKVVATRWDRLTPARPDLQARRCIQRRWRPQLELLDDDLNLSTIGAGCSCACSAPWPRPVERIRERSEAGKAHRKAMGLVDVAPFGMRQVGGQLEPDRELFLSLLADRQTRSRADLLMEMIGILEEKLASTPHGATWGRPMGCGGIGRGSSGC